MKLTLSKSIAKQKIKEFFKSNNFTPKQLKKIKRLAMHFKIRLGPLRKKFCKNCLNPLIGKIRITKTHKTIECKHCLQKNKFKLI